MKEQNKTEEPSSVPTTSSQNGYYDNDESLHDALDRLWHPYRDIAQAPVPKPATNTVPEVEKKEKGLYETLEGLHDGTLTTSPITWSDGYWN